MVEVEVSSSTPISIAAILSAVLSLPVFCKFIFWDFNESIERTVIFSFPLLVNFVLFTALSYFACLPRPIKLVLFHMGAMSGICWFFLGLVFPLFYIAFAAFIFVTESFPAVFKDHGNLPLFFCRDCLSFCVDCNLQLCN